MSENKELLEATVKGLQDKIGQLNMDLKTKQQELEDVNKPVLPHDTYALLEDIVSNAIGEYSFECGEFDYEFNLDYDNKIELSDLSYNDGYRLAESIMNKIDNYFKIEQNDN